MQQDIVPAAQKNCIQVAKALQSIASSQAPAGPLTEEDAVKLRVAIDALWETLRVRTAPSLELPFVSTP